MHFHFFSLWQGFPVELSLMWSIARKIDTWLLTTVAAVQDLQLKYQKNKKEIKIPSDT